MATIGETAKTYESKQMKNIADLEVVRTDVEFKTETRHNTEENRDYTVSFIEHDSFEYRVPGSVLEQLKGILESNPNLKTFRVKRTGTGLNTKYQVISLG